MIERISQGQAAGGSGTLRGQKAKGAEESKAFESIFQERLKESAQSAHASSVNFSKHAINRAEERGIELTPDLMDKLADSVEKAQEKGATNILAFDARQAFIINVSYGRVITTMSQDELKDNIFTNIDGAVHL